MSNGHNKYENTSKIKLNKMLKKMNYKENDIIDVIDNNNFIINYKLKDEEEVFIFGLAVQDFKNIRLTINKDFEKDFLNS